MSVVSDIVQIFERTLHPVYSGVGGAEVHHWSTHTSRRDE
jgi:hypothetical protein